jgi:hypothetical protein
MAVAFFSGLLGRKRKNEDVQPEANKAVAKPNYYCDNKWTQRCNVYVESEHDSKEEKPVLYSNKPECDQACQRPGGLLNDLWRTVFAYEPNVILQPAFDIKEGERFLNYSYTPVQIKG